MLPLLLIIAAVWAVQWQPFDASRLNGSFLEQFDYELLADSPWVLSKGLKNGETPYLGEWAVEESDKFAPFDGDRGLVMKREAAYHGLSRKLPSTFTAEGDLVLQFEVKFQLGVSCSGGYVKLLSSSDSFEESEFSDLTPFEIMFGPDICGSQTRVVTILRHEKDGQMVESRVRTLPLARTNVLLNLYTLVLRQNGDLDVRINGELAKTGNIYSKPHFVEPPVVEPEYIEDSSAQKPEDWDDRAYIVDPDAEKPADYDEKYGSAWMDDPQAKKPEGWNDEPVPSFIPKPDAKKPDLWLDEEDGVWEAPLIQNPECLHGCGKWEPPRVINPNYRGIWTPPQISNPNYKGVWTRPIIKNPKFGTDRERPLFGDIGAIGFDLWTMTPGVLFDNLYLGHSVEEAETIGNETFVTKSLLEWEDYEENKPQPKNTPVPPPKSFDELLDEDDTLGSLIKALFGLVTGFYVNLYYGAGDYWREFKAEPAEKIAEDPALFAVYMVAAIVTLLAAVVALNVVVFLALQATLPKSAAAAKKDMHEKSDKTELRSDSQGGTATGAQAGETAPVRRKAKQ